MPDTYWLNGSFITRSDAKLSAFDASVQHGVGLFETMHGAKGRVFRLEHHMKRLRDSARELGLSDSLRDDRLAEAVQLVLDGKISTPGVLAPYSKEICDPIREILEAQGMGLVERVL